MASRPIFGEVSQYNLFIVQPRQSPPPLLTHQRIDNIAKINTVFGIDVKVPTTIYALAFTIESDTKFKDEYRIIILEDFPQAQKSELTLFLKVISGAYGFISSVGIYQNSPTMARSSSMIDVTME